MASQKYKCPYCGIVKDVRGIRLHMQSCKKNPMRKEFNLSELERVQEEDHSADCEHSYRLLRVNNPLEAQAKKMGYTKICVNCEDLK